jgi:hypothetical protein
MLECLEYVRLASYGIYDSDLFLFYIHDQRSWTRSLSIDELNPSIYLQLGVL